MLLLKPQALARPFTSAEPWDHKIPLIGWLAASASRSRLTRQQRARREKQRTAQPHSPDARDADGEGDYPLSEYGREGIAGLDGDRRRFV